MKITVPATSANIGPGFDSVGLAVSKYLTIEVIEKSDTWNIEHELGEQIPHDEKNLLVKIARKVAPNLVPHHVKMISDIPLARGLGSSSSVIVAGIELANQLAELDLTDHEKLQIATELEGHPDNVAPAIFGNLVVASYQDGQVSAVCADFPACHLLAFVPAYELKTKDSRGVLPENLSYKEAVAASSIANVAIAALLKGDLKTAGQAIQSDLFHERFRQSLVAEFASIKQIGQEHGAYATYLSGAGPTIMILAPEEKVAAIKQEIIDLHLDGEVFDLCVDEEGVRVD
ncbi:homoserine kinase [Streptococcus pneumoniae]